MVLFQGLPEGTSFVSAVLELSKLREEKKKLKVNLMYLLPLVTTFSPNFQPANTQKPTLFLNHKSVSVQKKMA